MVRTNGDRTERLTRGGTQLVSPSLLTQPIGNERVGELHVACVGGGDGRQSRSLSPAATCCGRMGGGTSGGDMRANDLGGGTLAPRRRLDWRLLPWRCV